MGETYQQSVVRSQGMCGELLNGGRDICILAPGHGSHDGPHPIFERLEMLKSNLSMRFMRAARSGDDSQRDALLAKIDSVEVVQRIAHEEYGDLT